MDTAAGLVARVSAMIPGGTSPQVRFVYLVLLANGLPAFLILNLAPAHTDVLFVWTVSPPASAQLLGVMYGNALLLVAIGALQPDWPRARITMVLISYFSVAATIVTLLHLGPFLAHPWFHLAYWLSMYVILCVAAPLTLFWEERRRGVRLSVDVPLAPATRAVTALASALLLGLGVALFASPQTVSQAWPWPLTALVGRILAVWFSAQGIAFAWALRDGDWLRARPLHWAGVPTGVLLALVPLLHLGDLRAEGQRPWLYAAVVVMLAAGGLLCVLVQRRSRRPLPA